MIADLKLRQSEITIDNQSQLDSDSEQSDSDINTSLDMIIYDDINLDPITNDEFASASKIIDNQSKSETKELVNQYESFPSIEPLINEISIMSEKNIVSKFNILGQKAITEARANENLVNFAATLPHQENVQKY